MCERTATTGNVLMTQSSIASFTDSTDSIITRVPTDKLKSKYIWIRSIDTYIFIHICVLSSMCVLGAMKY